MTGEPGCDVECNNKNGNRKQTRRYGPDGFPETDTDWDHWHEDLGHLILMIGLGQPTAVGQITATVATEDHLYQAIREFQSRKIKEV